MAAFVGQSPPGSSRNRPSHKELQPPPVPDHKGLTALRVTMVGAERVGKTSLVSAFINNFCPMIYAQTWDPALFYKTMEIPSIPTDPQSQLLPLLVEIEDTYAWRSISPDSDVAKDEIEAQGVDRFGRKRDPRLFAKATGATVKALKKSTDARREASETGDLFSPFVIENEDKFVPITHRRMGYMVVFDPTEASSLEIAKEIVETIQHEGGMPEPVVYMVACKLDKVFHDDDRRTLKEAEEFVTSKNGWLKMCQVSAMDLHQVRRVFRYVVLDVHASGALWREEFDKKDTGWSMFGFLSPTSAAAAGGGGKGGGKGGLLDETVHVQRKGVPETPARSAAAPSPTGSPAGAAGAGAAGACGNQDCSLQ